MGKFVVKQSSAGYKFDLMARNGEIVASSQIYHSEIACIKGIESVRSNCYGEIEDQTLKDRSVFKHPKYEIYLDKAGEYRFRLKARNGEIIAVGQGYSSKESCLKGISSIKKNAPDAAIIKI